MSEGFFTIELGHYGFMIDTAWCYIALSWQLLTSALILFVGAKVYNRIKSTKGVK